MNGKKKLICLDTETTGFSQEFDRIIEIGCADITNGIDKKITYQQYINPKRNISQGAIDVHGLTLDFLKDFKSFENYIVEFKNFIKDSTLIIHNANFDMGFLNAEFKRHGHEPLENEVIDTLKLAKQMFPGKKVNLNALQTYFNIKIQRELHGALLDAEILANIYIAMQTQQTGLDIKNIDSSYKTKINPSENLIKVSQEEKNLHESFFK